MPAAPLPPASLGNRAGPPHLRAVSGDRFLPETPAQGVSCSLRLYMLPGAASHVLLSQMTSPFTSVPCQLGQPRASGASQLPSLAESRPPVPAQRAPPEGWSVKAFLLPRPIITATTIQSDSELCRWRGFFADVFKVGRVFSRLALPPLSSAALLQASSRGACCCH